MLGEGPSIALCNSACAQVLGLSVHRLGFQACNMDPLQPHRTYLEQIPPAACGGPMAQKGVFLEGAVAMGSSTGACCS